MFKQFYSENLIISYFKNHLNTEISTQFINCSDSQLREDFIKQTGLKLNKVIGLGLNLYPEFIYHSDIVSEMSVNVSIANYGNPAIIMWKSKSGRVYKLSDTDIDCQDIILWFDGLDPLEYHKQLQPNNTHPFNLTDLNYELSIEALNMEMTLQMTITDEYMQDADAIQQKIDDFIEKYNLNSMKKDRANGVVHNWKRRLEENTWVYEIDTGSAGVPFLKKLLKYLDKLNCFSRVVIS